GRCDGLPSPPARIGPGGFSRAAGMSDALGLGKGRPRTRALFALSGFIPTVEGWVPGLEPPFPPIAIAHGSNDPVISVDFGRRARDILEAAGAGVLYHESPIGHSIDPQVIPLLRGLFSL